MSRPPLLARRGDWLFENPIDPTPVLQITEPVVRSATRMQNARRYLPHLILLFIGSGCAALIYEIVWFQILELVIGSSSIRVGRVVEYVHGGHVRTEAYLHPA